MIGSALITYDCGAFA